MASVKANPRINVENNSPFSEGFRAKAFKYAPNTTPMPTPAPATPTVAIPADNNLAATTSIVRTNKIMV